MFIIWSNYFLAYYDKRCRILVSWTKTQVWQVRLVWIKGSMLQSICPKSEFLMHEYLTIKFLERIFNQSIGCWDCFYVRSAFLANIAAFILDTSLPETVVAEAVNSTFAHTLCHGFMDFFISAVSFSLASCKVLLFKILL